MPRRLRRGFLYSFKNRAALEYECFQMIAQGAKCSVGDQLHPNGKLDGATYDLIEAVYAQIENVEAWCEGARPLAEIGLLSSEGLWQRDWESLLPEPILGATRMLQELGAQFDIVETATGQADFSTYRLLILPDDLRVDEELANHLAIFLENGGAILGSGEGGLRAGGSDFALPTWPARRGEPTLDDDGQPFSPDFLVPLEGFAPDLPRASHVMYRGGLDLAPATDSRVLARRNLAFFNRTARHFCSHAHAPDSERDGGPAIVRRGKIVHFAHPIFTIYREKAPRWCKILVAAALREILGAPLLEHSGPSTLQAILHEQTAHNRWVLHLLHYVPERRAPGLDIIEEALPLRDLAFVIRAPKQVVSVRAVPQNEPLDFVQDGEMLRFRVARVNGHQLVEIAFLDKETA